MATKLNNSVVTRDCSVGGVLPPRLQALVDLRSGATSIPITDITGRIQLESNIFIGGIAYEDYAMRRKAEALQYNKNRTSESQKVMFSKMQFRKRVRNVDLTKNCPVLVFPPSNSGVTDLKFSGYYLNKEVPFRTSL